MQTLTMSCARVQGIEAERRDWRLHIARITEEKDRAIQLAEKVCAPELPVCVCVCARARVHTTLFDLCLRHTSLLCLCTLRPAIVHVCGF